MEIPEHDVIVVGAGNAATCAALSARESGASVLMVEIAPETARGGNSAFTGGAFRVVYHGFDDLARLIPDLSEHELANVDVGTYTAEQYYDDMGRLTEYRCDPDLTEILITRSFETALWMRAQGVRFQLGLGGRRSRWRASSSSGAASPAISGAAARS
jgi:tricarballylate dehydrogenase